MLFDYVRITLYFGMFELRAELRYKRAIFSYVCLLAKNDEKILHNLLAGLLLKI